MRLREQFFKAFYERNAIQRFAIRKLLFNIFQRCGVHITADHFYEIVPNTRLIAKQYTNTPRLLPGIDMRLTECELRCLRLMENYAAEYPKTSTRFGFQEQNSYFRGMDALLLYSVLRDLKPQRVVEIGQGWSTRIALAALERNSLETGTQPTLVSIDPYPRFVASDLPSCVSLDLIQQPIQSLEIDGVLRDCHFLFVDSSHVYKYGSDVAFELSTLYPRLPSNTVLHIHDVFSPFDYPVEWMVKEKRFWNEQYVIECFLMFNSAFDVYLPVHLLSRQSEAVMQAVKSLPLGPLFRTSGCSFYLKRK